jgi:sugar lactone lactonase YvrE
VLVADSVLGSVWAVDAATGRYGMVLDFDELAPPANSSIPLGVNGIHIRNGYLYWSNTAAQAVYRAKITSAGTLAGGARPELVARLETVVDDFAVDEQGQVWITTNIGNTVELVGKSGKIRTAVGDIGSLAVAGDTAAVFGRGKKDKEVLYVVTCGALVRPVNGTITEPGKVVAVDTKRLQI